MTTLALNKKFSRNGFSARLSAVFNRVDLWLQKAHQRRMLAELDARQRKDLGLSLEQVRVESGKPFWS